MTSVPRAEVLVGALALVLALTILAIHPAGTDLAAQSARASFARGAPLTPVDLSWYGGTYPYAYSALSPVVMAVLGVPLTGILATVAASVLFTLLLRGSQRPLMGGIVIALCLAANLVSGRTTFALGAVAGLACLLLLRRDVSVPASPEGVARRSSAGCGAVSLALLTGLLSPVAAAFLGFAALLLVLRRRRIGWAIGAACTLPVAVLSLAFPIQGVQVFTLGNAGTMACLSLVLALMTSSSTLRWGAMLYAPLILLVQAFSTPFGSNVTRLGLVVAAALVVATSTRPLPVVLAAAAFCLYYQVTPARLDLLGHPGPSTHALVTQLEQRHAVRVEVLAPRDHEESAAVARHVPLARGWLRQVDFSENRLFYIDPLSAGAFVDWLHAHSVDFVAVPEHTKLDFGSTREAVLLSHSLPGLTQVWSNGSWRLLAVNDPTPLVSAPALAIRSERTQLVLRSPGPAQVDVNVRWSRWLTAAGAGCLTHRGSQTQVRFAQPGEVRISSSLMPSGHC